MRMPCPRPLLRLLLLHVRLLGLPPALRGAMASAPGAWCPRFHDIYQPNMYDPSAPIRLKDGTWHVFPDGCGGWCHYSSPDLFRWTQHAPLPKLGGLTGSLSYTDEGMFLLHPKGGDWIARSVPNGTDAAKLDDFDDSSCTISGRGKNATGVHCAATAPNHGNGWPVGLDGNFMDPSRAVRLSDGSWYVVCGAGCMGACQSPRDDGKVGVPWFRATDSTLSNFELAGYLQNVTSSLGKLSSNQWSNETVPCHFQACPDVFPLGEDPELFVVISSVYPVRLHPVRVDNSVGEQSHLSSGSIFLLRSVKSMLFFLVQAWTNEWWVGRIAPGLGHFDTTAFTPIEGAHGVLDYGGVYAAKTGADTVIDQRQSTRRVMFSSTGWQRKGVPGCEPQQTMPRELTLSTPAEALRHGEGGAPFLWIEPAKELTTLRTTVPPKFRAIAGTPGAMISGAGAQVEVVVSCSQIKPTETEMSLTLTVLRSKDGREGVRVSYWQTNNTLQVDHRLANSYSPSNLVQNAPVPPAIVSTNGSLELRVVIDGGLIETFLGRRIAVTSLIGLPPVTPPGPPHRPVKDCTPTNSLGCRFESNCGGDPTKVNAIELINLALSIGG